MNTEFIKTKHQAFTYQRKEGTKCTFLMTNGKRCLLPERLSIIPYCGKAGHRKANYQVNGYYKKNDSGLYINLNPKRTIHTKIWDLDNYPMFAGCGEIDQRKGIYDLIIIYSKDNCKDSFELHHFTGLAKPQYIDEAATYLQSLLNNKSPHDGLLKG